MLSLDVIKKYEEIINFYNVNRAYLSDVVTAIVITDSFHGSNKKEMDIDRLSVSSDELNQIWGIKKTAINCQPLPDVQMMRIIVDSLVLALNKLNISIDNTHLTMQKSRILSEGKQVRSCDDYSDMQECEKVFNIIYESIKSLNLDFSWLLDFEKCLSKLTVINSTFDLLSHIRTNMKGLKVPIECKTISGRCKPSEFEDMEVFKNKYFDNVQFIIMFFFISNTKDKFKESETKLNLSLNRLAKYNFCIGTFSVGNYAPRIEFGQDIPLYIAEKIGEVFSKGKAYNKFDIIPTLCCLEQLFVYNLNKFEAKEVLKDYEF